MKALVILKMLMHHYSKVIMMRRLVSQSVSPRPKRQELKVLTKELAMRCFKLSVII
jgi:hypothetical protein